MIGGAPFIPAEAVQLALEDGSGVLLFEDGSSALLL